MRVFVVGTGRCGTSTFFQAARYLEGWTAGHETFAGDLATTREYPDRHVEVDAQLVWRIPQLTEQYPDAKWVHLVRDREACIRSLAGQSYDAMASFAHLVGQSRSHLAVPAAAALYYDLTNLMITALRPFAFYVHIENLVRRWPEFLEWLGPDVRCNPAVAEVFGRAYNPGVARGRDSFIPREEVR